MYSLHPELVLNFGRIEFLKLESFNVFHLFIHGTKVPKIDFLKEVIFKEASKNK